MDDNRENSGQQPRPRDKNFVKVCALWPRKDKNGKTYYGGTSDVDGKFYAVFPVKFPKDRGPEYEIFAGEKTQQGSPPPSRAEREDRDPSLDGE